MTTRSTASPIAIPGTGGAFRAGFTPERVCFEFRTSGTALPECCIEVTDRPIFATAQWNKSRNGLNAMVEGPLGRAEVRAAKMVNGIVRIEYVDDLEAEAQRRIRLSAFDKDAKVLRPLPTRFVVELPKRGFFAVQTMFADSVEADLEDSYGAGLRIESKKDIAVVLFLAVARTRSSLDKTLEAIYA